MERKKMDRHKIVYLVLSFLVAVTLWIFGGRLQRGNGGDRDQGHPHRVPEHRYGAGPARTDAAGGGHHPDRGCEADRFHPLEQYQSGPLRRPGHRGPDRRDGDRTQRITITILYSEGAEGISKKSTSPSMATVNIGELYHKEVEVRCERVGTVAEGYSAGELELSPSVVEIRGQQEDIDPVSYVKVVLNYDNATSTITEELDFQYYDANDQLLSGEGIHPTVDKITAMLPVNVTKS